MYASSLKLLWVWWDLFTANGSAHILKFLDSEFMKHSTLFLSCVFVAGAHAQVWTLPPSSLLDGVAVKPVGANTSWSGPLSLGAYGATGDGDSDRLVPDAADTELGLVWTHALPDSFLAMKDALVARGGTLRMIFVGETAGGRNDLGYTYSGSSQGAGAFTVFAGIQAAGSQPTVSFGQHVDIAFATGQASAFDLWFNAVDGGTYNAFNATGGQSAAVGQQFLWANPLPVETWVPSVTTYANIPTYIVSVEDLRLTEGADRDYSDFRFALQFLDANGEALAAIPEPAHFAALLGLLAAAGVLVVRWRKAA